MFRSIAGTSELVLDPVVLGYRLGRFRFLGPDRILQPPEDCSFNSKPYSPCCSSSMAGCIPRTETNPKLANWETFCGRA